MGLVPEVVDRLSAEFGRLPGVGPKTAQRLTFFCMGASVDSINRLATALVELRQSVKSCSKCFFIATEELCPVCSNPRRDKSLLCVVEEVVDVLAIERSAEFAGSYHVLQGAISPLDGVGPDQIRIRELHERIVNDNVKEIIIATDPDVEGEATAHYLADRLSKLGVTVSRLAHGLPAGSDLQYADELTVARAFTGRRILVNSA